MLPAFEHGGHFPRAGFVGLQRRRRFATIFRPSLNAWNIWGIPFSGGKCRAAASPIPARPPAPCRAVCPRRKFKWTACGRNCGASPKALGELAGKHLDDQFGWRTAFAPPTGSRRTAGVIAPTVYAAPGAPLPALEMLVAEMLAIHFCSDRAETIAVLGDLLAEAQSRARRNQFAVSADAARIFWVNPVADLRAMNLLEEIGGRICGTDYMFTHALDLIPEDLPPLEALARAALADPMVGPASDRAARIVRECRANGAEALVVSRIPGASHCAREGEIILQFARREIGIPAIELEISPGLRRDADGPPLAIAGAG
jgi:hypothetical protein